MSARANSLASDLLNGRKYKAHVFYDFVGYDLGDSIAYLYGCEMVLAGIEVTGAKIFDCNGNVVYLKISEAAQKFDDRA